MAINKISGNILQDDLQRGSNLAIQGNLIYFDVTNDRVGILTSSPGDDFAVLGTANAANVRITSATANRIFYADSNKLAQTTANLTFDGTDLVLVGSATIDNVTVDGTEISSDANLTITSGNNGNIDIVPNGTGVTNISNLVIGNLDANRVVITLASGALADTDAFTFDTAGNILTLTGQANFDDLQFDGSTIATTAVNANLNLTPNGSGKVVAATLAITDLSANRVLYSQDADGTVVDSANFTFDGANVAINGSLEIDNVTIDGGNIASDTALTITTAANGNITLQTDGTGVVRIPDTNGMVIPVGNTDQRPSPVDVGTIRFNTTINEIEVWDGTQWDEVGGAVPFTITNQTITPDGVADTFTLDQDATDASILLTINGVNQTPTIDYSVTGNSLVLSDIPLSTDIIQVRFLAGIESNDRLTNSAGNATIIVETSGSIDIDSTGTITATGNLIPTANITYDLGNSSSRWRDLYLSGSSLTLGNIVIKNTGGNSIGFFGPDGVTPATLDANVEVVADSIASGTSQVSIVALNGNIQANVAGATIFTASSTGLAVTGNVSSTNITGILTTAAQPNITSVGTLSDLLVTGNISGTLTTAAQPNITSVGTLGSLTVSGNISSGNVSGTNITGTLTTAAQPNVTSVGTLGSLTVTGNISGGNLVTAGALTVNSGSGATAIVNAAGNGVGNIGSSSTYFDTVFAKATSAQYADLAEKFIADHDYDPGTVLKFGGEAQVTVADSYADPRAAGIVTTAPAFLMNSGQTGISAAIALAGQVPCWVTGPVSKGDLLTTSDLPGHACRLDPEDWRPGCVIAKSLEDRDDGNHKILVVIYTI